ncbi:MAG TPA: alkaline phosphatase family protein [Tepidisphaeraceae bacterium]|nr:alkaline phosphatase family protein [Tepidisphaeraceae bacterium]
MVINVVGLTPRLLGHMPRLRAFAAAGKIASIGHVTPAVTCSVQATYLTGTPPREHGIVGNGWYDRTDAEIKFWKQSDKLVQRPRIWEIARTRDPSFTCANLFWWYAMYSSADITVTPRPMYPADGRKLPDVWTNPGALRSALQEKFGQFPLFKFWGPMAGIESSQWIADAGRLVWETANPTMQLVYIPHLDYDLQRHGPDSPQARAAARAADDVVAPLLECTSRSGGRIVVLSEYGIEPVQQPIHINRALRQAGLLAIRTELGRELLDAGASRAFAVADHQVAHIYVNDPGAMTTAERIVRAVPGVGEVYSGERTAAIGADHDRAGDLIAVASPGAWFTYYYWEHDPHAPDFARTVDIHRKPGYDPAELLLDPAKPLLKARIAWKLLKRKLGFRSLLDVIPLDAGLVRGSHGRPPASPEEGPVFITDQPGLLDSARLAATDVCGLILRHLFD